MLKLAGFLFPSISRYLPHTKGMEFADIGPPIFSYIGGFFALLFKELIGTILLDRSQEIIFLWYNSPDA